MDNGLARDLGRMNTSYAYLHYLPQLGTGAQSGSRVKLDVRLATAWGRENTTGVRQGLRQCPDKGGLRFRPLSRSEATIRQLQDQIKPRECVGACASPSSPFYTSYRMQDARLRLLIEEMAFFTMRLCVGDDNVDMNLH